VNRTLIVGVSEGECFLDVLQDAGGFTDGAFSGRVGVIRKTGKEKAVSDVYQDQFGIFSVKGGDKYTVGKILDRFNNRVQIKGAVFREGNYALSEGLTLLDLIDKAEGLRGEAYLQSASVLRTREDLTTQLIQVNLKEVI